MSQALVSVKYVRLVSSASLDIYPSNTTVSFTNVLPSPLNVPKSEGWRVCLSSIVCSNHFARDSKVHFLKVKCPQVSPKLGQTPFISCHSRKHFHRFTNRVHVFAPKHKEYFDLNSDIINELSITLLDNIQEKPVTALEFGQPTIITLKLKRSFQMDTKMHTVRVSNRTERDGMQDISPSNNFMLSLPPELSVLTEKPGTNWIVAFTSMTFECMFKQIRRTDDFVHVKVYDDNFENVLTEKREPIPDFYFRDEEDCVMKLKAFFKRINRNELNTPLIKFAAGFMEDKYSSFVFYKNLLLDFPYNFAKILGNHSQPNDKGRIIMKVKKTTNTLTIFRKPIDINAGTPNTLLLYTNFIKPSPMGGTMAPILKLIPINYRESGIRGNKYQTYEAESLEFHPVAFRDLCNLEFSLYTMEGELVQFQDPMHELNITMFVKKQ